MILESHLDTILAELFKSLSLDSFIAIHKDLVNSFEDSHENKDDPIKGPWRVSEVDFVTQSPIRSFLFIESEPLELFIIWISFKLKVDQTKGVLTDDEVGKEDNEEVTGFPVCLF